jgi:two-component system alkaline phosphatase synthesis response regulator PhoP
MREDRRVLRQMLRARGGLTVTLRVVRSGKVIPVQVLTAAVIRATRVVALEGVARPLSREREGAAPLAGQTDEGPMPQRLAALMYEVHALLHRVLPGDDRRMQTPAQRLQLGALTLDLERLSVEESGQPVALTSREMLVLRYLLMRPDRVVTRQQLLQDVWGYQYMGDDRTIDVHISRLRRKLPSLAARLVAVKHVGYRLESDDAVVSTAS